MEITEVRIKLADASRERLRAFCSITIDGCFVIRDLKIIHGTKGPFVAMPSRKLTDRCPRCGSKNCLRAVYCGQCGTRLPDARGARSHDGRAKLYADIAHPINSACREAIQAKVLDAFEQEKTLAGQPGYVCRYDDFGDDDDDPLDEWADPPREAGTSEPQQREPVASEPEPREAAASGPHRRLESAAAMEGPHPARLGTSSSHTRRAAGDAASNDEFGAGIISGELPD